MSDRPRVLVWTDGSCAPNPGPGGWACVLVSPAHGDHRRELSGGERDTTNNRMEITAAIRALEALRRPCRVTLHTDSRYLMDAIDKRWIRGWKRNGWLTKEKTPVKNVDLWQQLDVLCERHEVTWVWVKGHAGDAENERCDELARVAREGLGAPARA